jgi:hypothetical protein
MKTKLLLIFVFAMLTMAMAKQQQYEIEFGLLDQEGSSYYVKEHTLKIPYITKSEGQVFGAVVHPNHNNEYVLTYQVVLPQTPVVLEVDQNKARPAQIVNSPEYRLKGSGAATMWLHDGDPSGNYQLKIKIDGEVMYRGEFTVEPKR